MLQDRSKLASCTRTHPSQNADSWFKDGISPSWKQNQLTAAKTQKHRSWKPEQCWFFQWNVPLKPWKKHVPQLERPNFLYILGVFWLLALDVCFSSFFVDIIVLIPCDLPEEIPLKTEPQTTGYTGIIEFQQVWRNVTYVTMQMDGKFQGFLCYTALLGLETPTRYVYSIRIV